MPPEEFFAHLTFQLAELVENYYFLQPPFFFLLLVDTPK